MNALDLSENLVFGRPSENSQYKCNIFVIMPFDTVLVPLFEDHLKAVANGLGYSISRGDDFFSKGSIMADVWSAIVCSRLAIADCTGRNPNVFYELGIAHALNKAVIMITQNIDDIPHDIRHLRAIKYEYSPEGMKILEESLKSAIEKILSFEHTIENLRENPSDLPTGTDEQWRIVEHIVNMGDFETLEKITPFLSGTKLQTVRKLVEMNDISHAKGIVDSLSASKSLRSVAETLYACGHADTMLMRDVIDRIVNHTEKRALGRHIYQQRGEDSDVFRYLIETFINSAELRNLGILFLDDGRVDSPGFDCIVRRIEDQKKSPELRNLAIEFVRRDMTDRLQFRRVLTALAPFSDRARDVIDFWVRSARDSAEEALSQGVVDDPGLREYLESVLSSAGIDP